MAASAINTQRTAARLLYEALRFADWLGAQWRRISPHSETAGPGLEPAKPGISVIIPERANPVLLQECLRSLGVACAQLPEPFEVIVVVNGSPESLYRDLVRSEDSVRWMFFRRPLWFSGAIRRGLKAARYDWVYLLNNDMVLDSGALRSLLKWRSSNVFAIASQIYLKDPQRRREETGWTVYREADGPIEILDEVPDDDVTVRGTFYAGGGASLFRRRLLAEFIPDSSAYHPFYWEDVEWGTRAWRCGYEVLYCPASKAWHGHRQTNRKFFSEPEIDRILARNRFVFHFRNGPCPESFRAFEDTLGRLDEKSLREILTPRRMSQIASGRFRNSFLPLRHASLEYTWQKRYGCTDAR
jgi:GT2 family glycosyltransferase